jgi:BlaI family penicillinase repressor
VTDKSPISETELAVLKALWSVGSGTVRDLDPVLRREGRDWAYNTVLTLLQRLQAKGFVKSDKRALAHVFSPAVSREQLLRRRLRDLVDDVCEGTATPLVRALVEGQRFSSKEIEELRELVDKLSEKPAAPRGKKKES